MDLRRVAALVNDSFMLLSVVLRRYLWVEKYWELVSEEKIMSPGGNILQDDQMMVVFEI